MWQFNQNKHDKRQIILKNCTNIKYLLINISSFNFLKIKYPNYLVITFLNIPKKCKIKNCFL